MTVNRMFVAVKSRSGRSIVALDVHPSFSASLAPALLAGARIIGFVWVETSEQAEVVVGSYGIGSGADRRFG